MRRFAQDCDPPTYSCTSRNAPKKAKLSKGRLRSNGEAARQGPRRKDAKIAHIKSGVRLTRNPTRFASHVAHQNVRQNRFAITVQQLHIRVTHYSGVYPFFELVTSKSKRTLDVRLLSESSFTFGRDGQKSKYRVRPDTKSISHIQSCAENPWRSVRRT